MGSPILRFIFGEEEAWISLPKSIFLVARRGVVLGDDVGVSGDGVDDDGGVVLAWAADFDRYGAVVDDDHLF